MNHCRLKLLNIELAQISSDYVWNFKLNQEKTQIIQKILNYQNTKLERILHKT